MSKVISENMIFMGSQARGDLDLLLKETASREHQNKGGKTRTLLSRKMS